MKWATTCAIGSPKYKDLKLRKKEEIIATEDALISS
jgi:hypothetical protein